MDMTPLPSLKAVKDHLTDLLGREVTVSAGQPVQVVPRKGPAIGVYINTSTQALAAILVVDFKFAAYAGAALGLTPAGRADDAIDEADLPEMILEGLYEVLNICCALYNVSGAPHLKLDRMIAPGESIPGDVLGYAKDLGVREDMAVEIKGYGKGAISFVTV